MPELRKMINFQENQKKSGSLENYGKIREVNNLGRIMEDRKSHSFYCLF